MSRRVPFVRQHAATECGAACLAMILRYHGRRTPLEECRERCGAGRDGASARAIADAARSYGLRARGYSADLGDFADVDLPAIVHWNFNHFVVVERFGRHGVTVADPAVGRRELTLEEFDEGFTGVVLTFEPGVDFQRGATPDGFTWRSYLKYVLGAPRIRGPVVQIFAASLVVQLLGLALPVFTKVVVDDVLPQGLRGVMPALGLGLLIWVAAQAITGYLRAALLIFVQARIDSHVMLGFFQHLLSLPFRYFQQRTSGDLLMRLGSNMILREMLTSQTVSTLLDGVLVIVYLGVLFAWNATFAWLALAIGLAQVALLLSTTGIVHRLMQRDLAAQADSQTYLVEALGGIATLKAAGAEDRALDYWSNLFFKHLQVSLQRSHLSALVETGMNALRIFSPLFLLWMGATFVLDGTMTLGTMLALNALAAAFLAPLASLVSSGQSFQLVGAHLDRIADVLGARPEQDAAAAAPVEQVEGRLELADVSFRYDPAAPLVLSDVSLSIEAGQKVAIVGRTGSGKSTLARLLLGLYPPTTGRVLCDGRPLAELDQRQLRRRFGVVLQEPFLFSGTIRENVALNDPSMPLDDVMEACALAAMDEDIASMPLGYESILAEGGSSLSGGQRQRLALARALAHRPAVLLLDEATSHLDTQTEARVDRNLSILSCTRVVIAHRLSTVRNADLIVVLDGGRIAERGDHDALIKHDGIYAELVQKQLEPA